MIQSSGIHLDDFIRYIRNIPFLGEIFSQQAVGVLVGSPLPWLMWLRIIEFYPVQVGTYLFEIVELAPPVRSDALMRQIFQHIDDGSGNAVGGLALHLAAQEHTALPVDQGDKAGFSDSAADGIGFPIAQTPSFIGDLRTLCQSEHERMPATTASDRFGVSFFPMAPESSNGAGNGLEIFADESAAIDAAVDRRRADGNWIFLLFTSGRQSVRGTTV